MRTKIIELFEKNRGRFLSGGRLADALHVSRAAVWKWVKLLQAEGYLIEAVHGKGYRLEEHSDILSSEAVRLSVSGEREIIVLPTVTSTNTYAKELAANGAAHGTAVLAETQTAGKGRSGRSFFSPGGTGLYMSVVLRPGVHTADSQFFTAAAAVAVAEAIRGLYGIDAKIKWVNDILVNGRKVCGILSEGSFSLENGKMDYVVVGIGINLSTRAYPPELSEKAASLSEFSEARLPRAKLAGEVLKRLDACIRPEALPQVLSAYKELSAVVGRRAVLSVAGGNETVEILDIDEEARLVVKTASGVRTLNSGEILSFEVDR